MLEEIRTILTNVLALGERGRSLKGDSPLLGTIPELDSMAIVSVINALEEHYDVEFDDDELSADTFATLATLTSLVERKVAQDDVSAV